ncbi:MAG: hypothetical protein CMJ84_10750, partial [Planctomycetes bacterium]|nr:hypothetical protein [Planctomycetota bacterium]
MARASWDLGGADLEQLLTEAAAARGESLWQDALRRLRRNRAAWTSLVFLGVFALLSLLAPVLPLPSPVTLDLQLEP